MKLSAQIEERRTMDGTDFYHQQEIPEISRAGLSWKRPPAVPAMSLAMQQADGNFLSVTKLTF